MLVTQKEKKKKKKKSTKKKVKNQLQFTRKIVTRKIVTFSEFQIDETFLLFLKNLVSFALLNSSIFHVNFLCFLNCFFDKLDRKSAFFGIFQYGLCLSGSKVLLI